MNTILGLLALLNISFASEAPFPKNWCSTGRCSPLQVKIWNEFNDGLSPNWDKMPQVFSGSCYHSSKHYNNSIEHFSGFIMDKEQDGFSFHGKHSYFVKDNPYKGLNLESARASLKKESLNRVEIFENYGFYNANPKADHPIRYWIRESRDEKIKMAVIYGSLDYFILCNLSYH